jgi:hypothetical protein
MSVTPSSIVHHVSLQKTWCHIQKNNKRNNPCIYYINKMENNLHRIESIQKFKYITDIW